MKFSEFTNLVPNGSIEYVNDAIIINANKLLDRNVNWDTDIESVLFYCLHKLSKGVNKKVNFTYGFPIIENGELWVYSQVGFTVKLPARFKNSVDTGSTLPNQDPTDPIESRQDQYPPSMFVGNLTYSTRLLDMEQVMVGLNTENALILFNYGDSVLQVEIWGETEGSTGEIIPLPGFDTAPGIISHTASQYPKYMKLMLGEDQFTIYRVELAEGSLTITIA